MNTLKPSRLKPSTRLKLENDSQGQTLSLHSTRACPARCNEPGALPPYQVARLRSLLLKLAAALRPQLRPPAIADLIA